MLNRIKFLISSGKGVKKMKSLKTILTGLLCLFLAAPNAFAESRTSTATVTATVSSESGISLPPNVIDFGSIAGNATTYRFRTPAVSVSYFAAGPYEINVYTQNGVGAAYEDGRGFIRNKNGDKLYLKIWCPNFNANQFIDPVLGPKLPVLCTDGRTPYPSKWTDYLWKGFDLNDNAVIDDVDWEPKEETTWVEDDIDLDLNGDGTLKDSITIGPDKGVKKIGEGASFSWVREKDTMKDGTILKQDVATRCVLTYNTIGQLGRKIEPGPDGSQDASLGSPFNVCFAVDLNGVKAGAYSSANNTTPVTSGQTATPGVIFEMIIY